MSTKIITIVLTDDLHPPTVYIGDMDPRIAGHACDQACQALAEEVAGMVVDRTMPTDWTP